MSTLVERLFGLKGVSKSDRSLSKRDSTNVSESRGVSYVDNLTNEDSKINLIGRSRSSGRHKRQVSSESYEDLGRLKDLSLDECIIVAYLGLRYPGCLSGKGSNV